MERRERVYNVIHREGEGKSYAIAATKKDAIRTARTIAADLAGSVGRKLHSYQYVEHYNGAKCPGCNADTQKVTAIFDTSKLYGKGECYICRWCGEVKG